MLENNKNSNDEFKNKHMNYWNARIKLSALTRVNEKKAENSNEGIKFNFKKVKQKSITDDINLEKTVKSNYKNKKYLEDSSNTINKPTRSKISKIDKIPNFDKLDFDKLNIKNKKFISKKLNKSEVNLLDYSNDEWDYLSDDPTIINKKFTEITQVMKNKYTRSEFK